MSKNIYPVWLFKVKDGDVIFEDGSGYDAYLKNHFEGKIGEIVAKPHRKKRTSGQEDEEGNQNGYYWAVIVRMIADETGMFDDEVHDFLRHKFLIKGKMANGIRFEVARSTADLSTVEFEDYCAKVRSWASFPGNVCEHGLYIPMPNEVSL